jgi:hypothetical protein
MSTTSNCPDLSRLVAHDYTFGAKVGKKSVSQVKHGGKILACKLLRGNMIHTLLEPDHEMRWSIEMVHGMKWLSKFIDKHDGDN